MEEAFFHLYLWKMCEWANTHKKKKQQKGGEKKKETKMTTVFFFCTKEKNTKKKIQENRNGVKKKKEVNRGGNIKQLWHRQEWYTRLSAHERKVSYNRHSRCLRVPSVLMVAHSKRLRSSGRLQASMCLFFFFFFFCDAVFFFFREGQKKKKMRFE